MVEMLIIPQLFEINLSQYDTFKEAKTGKVKH